MAETGGPTYPLEGNRGYRTKPCTGVTVRDFFAAYTDIPWEVVIDVLKQGGIKKPSAHQVIELRAKMRYAEADALLAERKS